MHTNASESCEASKGRKLVRAILVLMIGSCAGGGVALLAASFIPFETIKPRIDALAADGTADFFTIDSFRRLIFKTRLFGGGCIALGALLVGWRRPAETFGSQLLVSLGELAGKLRQYLTTTLVREERFHLGALLVIFMIGVAVRLYFLHIPMRYDEAYTCLTYASKPVFVGLSDYSTPNNHLFHTLLVHMTCVLLGDDPWAIRLPALLAGIALIPVSYLVIRELYDKHVGLLATGAIASAPLLIDYSTNARGYTLFCLIFLCCIALAQHLRRNHNRGAWFLLAVCGALGFYTIPIMLYALGIVIVWLFLSVMLSAGRASRSVFLKNLLLWGTLAGGLTIMLYMPVFVASGVGSVVSNPTVSPRPWAYFIHRLPDVPFSLWQHWHSGIPSVVGWLLLVGFVASLAFHGRISAYRIPFLLPVILWCVPVLTAQRLIPFDRVWMFLFPLYLGAAAAGVLHPLRLIRSRIGQARTPCVAGLALALSLGLCGNVLRTQSIYYSNEQGNLRQAEHIVALAKDRLRTGDHLLSLSPSSAPLRYYAYKSGLERDVLLWKPAQAAEAKRLLLVVNKPWYSLQKLLDKLEIRTDDFTEPRLIEDYKFVSVYEMTRGGKAVSPIVGG